METLVLLTTTCRILPQERENPLFGFGQCRQDDSPAHAKGEQGSGAPADPPPQPGRAHRGKGKEASTKPCISARNITKPYQMMRNGIMWNIQRGFVGGLDGRPSLAWVNAQNVSSVVPKEGDQTKFWELGVLCTLRRRMRLLLLYWYVYLVTQYPAHIVCLQQAVSEPYLARAEHGGLFF